MISRFWWLCVLIALACACWSSPSFAVTGAQARAACAADSANYKAHPPTVVTVDCLLKVFSIGGQYNLSGSFGDRVYPFDGPPPTQCTAGVVPPIGAVFQAWSPQGVTCYDGCDTSLEVGGPNNGMKVLNGNLCPMNPGQQPPNPDPPPPPSETCHADGTCTWCDTISGKCVTAGKPPQTVPPSSSSSGGPNNTTTTNSNTTNGPTTSTTTTNTTTTNNGTWTSDGGGTGGGGTGSSGTTSGTSTTTGTSTTDTPASSSSTSSKCTGGVCDVGQADGDTGALYSAGVDTPGSVYENFKARVASSPLISAASGFFTVSASGSCPTWHIPGNQYWGQAGFDFAFFCDSGILAILALAGWVVLAVAAFSAFRIALY